LLGQQLQNQVNCNRRVPREASTDLDLTNMPQLPVCKGSHSMINRYLTICLIGLLSAFTVASHTSVAIADESATRQTGAGENYLFTEILQLSNAYFGRFPFMRAEDVYAKIIQGDDTSYLLVSVQSPEEYSKGHVPGAINIPLGEIAEAKSLSLLPPGKKIVFTCDNGHRSMVAALFFGQLGYETYAMSMGLSYWNGAGAGISSPYPGSAGYPVSIVSISPPRNHTPPTIAGTGGRETIIARTGAIVANERNLFIDRNEVYAKAVQGGDPSYFLVSLQSREDYSKGHVPGAINIPVSEFAKAESLSKLPRDKKIVLICYVGHWGGSAALFLNQLGYEAYDMRFGTLGWNDATDGLGAAKGYLLSLGKSLELPVEKGRQQ